MYEKRITLEDAVTEAARGLVWVLNLLEPTGIDPVSAGKEVANQGSSVIDFIENLFKNDELEEMVIHDTFMLFEREQGREFGKQVG